MDIVNKATTRKEDVPIDVNKRQAEENDDMTKKLVGLYLYISQRFRQYDKNIVFYFATKSILYLVLSIDYRIV